MELQLVLSLLLPAAIAAGSMYDLYDSHHCCVYSEELLLMDRGTV